MATIRRNATTCIVSTYDEQQPAQTPGNEYRNTDEPTTAPNLADYSGATRATLVMELGGFDFSAIPAGSIINKITVRKVKRGLSGTLNLSENVDLKIAGIVRETKKWYADTDDQVVTILEEYDQPNITRDELATPGAFTVRTQSAHAKPPFSDQPQWEMV